MAEATWQGLALPTHKGKPGWEFTELGNDFDLASYETAPLGDLAAADQAELVFDLPADGVRMTQVDSAFHPVEEAVSEGPLVMPLSQAVEQHGDLVDKWLGSVVESGENAFTARNAAEWAGGAFVYVPAGV